MKTALMLLLLSSAVVAQTNFSIKGHVLGESLADLFSAAGTNGLSDCQEYVRNHHSKEGLLINGKQMTVNSEIKRCAQIKDAAEGRRAKFFVRQIGGDVQFDGGKLTAMFITFANNLVPEFQQISYAKIFEDATAKSGDPTESGTTTWQNGFGATFYPRYAKWVKEKFILTINEMPKPSPDILNANVMIEVSTPDEPTKNYKDKTAGPNVFGDEPHHGVLDQP